MDEYTDKKNKKNTNPRIKNTTNKISSEITFPQIKIISNEVNKKEDFQTTQVLKTLTNTPKANKKVNNRLILSNNKKPFLYKPLLDNQRLITYNNYENKDTMSASLEKKDEKESKEKIEDKDYKLNKEIINNKKEKEEINNIDNHNDIDSECSKETERKSYSSKSSSGSSIVNNKLTNPNMMNIQNNINNLKNNLSYQKHVKYNSGKLSVKEIKNVFGGTEAQWKQVIDEVDLNNDGEVDFGEFKIMMINMNKNQIIQRKKTSEKSRGLSED